MAQVVQDANLKETIEHYYLDLLFSRWASVPAHARTWSTMDAADKEAFHLEWIGITEARLEELDRWAAEGTLTPEQHRRYEQLTQLVARHRPTIERMLAT
jgi:hypothetical protein